MKKILSLVVTWGLLWAVLGGCAPEKYPLPNGDVPVASSLQITHAVGERNFVTFSIANPQMVPVWIFGEKDVQTGNDYSRQYKQAGNYSVEVKAYNFNGMSDGSIIYNFTITESYFDPYDETLDLRNLTGGGTKEWIIDAATPGHIGCGNSYGVDGSDGTGLNWWSAGPYEKDGWSFYDNTLSFSVDHTYTFDPVDGLIYVNKEVTVGGFQEYLIDPDQDFTAPYPVQTTTFELSKEQDQLYLTFPENTTVGYIPNNPSFEKPVFKVLKLTANVLEIVIDKPEANGGYGIAWHFLFVPKVAQAGPEDLLTGGSSKRWKFNASAYGHLGCGEPGTDGLNWWAAPPFDKQDWGLYDDTFTFQKDGTYLYDPGESGTVYVNKDVEAFIEHRTDPDQDYTVPVDPQTATWRLSEEADGLYLIFPAHTFVGYIPNNDAWEEPVFKVLSIDENYMELVIDKPGIAWHFGLINADYDPDAPVPVDQDPDAYAANLQGSWTWDPSFYGHFGCGDSIGNPAGWWAAGPNEKDGMGFYDDLLSFAGDTYTFDPVDGFTYVNTGVSTYEPDYRQDEDFVAPAAVQESPYTLGWDETNSYITLTLAEGTLLSYLAHDEQLAHPVYYITYMDSKNMTIVWYTATGNGGGPIAWKYSFKRVN